MTYGDIGGPVTELILTCQVQDSATVERGDAVCLAGPYTVARANADDAPVFGQAFAPATGTEKTIPVKVRGICIFPYTGTEPVVDGMTGVTAAAGDGTVQSPAAGTGHGIVLKTDAASRRVHVLL